MISDVIVKSEYEQSLDIILDLAKQIDTTVCENDIEECYFINNIIKTKC